MADLRTQLANVILAELVKKPFESPEGVTRLSYEIADELIDVWSSFPAQATASTQEGEPPNEAPSDES